MTRPSITAAVIARDEEANIMECLECLVTWADETLVVLDAATRDRTAELARAAGARVEVAPFENFALQRDRALAMAQSDWVLFVDADERVTSELRDEVLATIQEPRGCAGYWIPRDNYILGRLVRGAGWSPDAQLRLLKRDAAHFDPLRVVHELALLDGPAGSLKRPFIHRSYGSLREFARKQERYSRLETQRWLATYGRPRLRALIGQPFREFLRRYVTLGGYREGLLGLVLCLMLAWYQGKAVWRARKVKTTTQF